MPGGKWLQTSLKTTSCLLVAISDPVFFGSSGMAITKFLQALPVFLFPFDDLLHLLLIS